MVFFVQKVKQKPLNEFLPPFRVPSMALPTHTVAQKSQRVPVTTHKNFWSAYFRPDMGKKSLNEFLTHIFIFLVPSMALFAVQTVGQKSLNEFLPPEIVQILRSAHTVGRVATPQTSVQAL